MTRPGVVAEEGDLSPTASWKPWTPVFSTPNPVEPRRPVGRARLAWKGESVVVGSIEWNDASWSTDPEAWIWTFGRVGWEIVELWADPAPATTSRTFLYVPVTRRGTEPRRCRVCSYTLLAGETVVEDRGIRHLVCPELGGSSSPDSPIEEWATAGEAVCGAPHPEVPVYRCQRVEGHRFPLHGRKVGADGFVCWRSPSVFARPWGYTLAPRYGEPGQYARIITEEEARKIAVALLQHYGQPATAEAVSGMRQDP